MLITGETVCWVWWDIWELSVLSDKFPINLKLFENTLFLRKMPPVSSPPPSSLMFVSYGPLVLPMSKRNSVCYILLFSSQASLLSVP